MIKKTKSKIGPKKVAKKKNSPKKPRAKKQANPAAVRNDIAIIVQSGAKRIAKAVMEQAMTGQLAPAKYLFEVAGVFPASTDGSHATADEDCLAKTLLDRLNIPDEPVGRDDEDEPVVPGQHTASKEEVGEKQAEGAHPEEEGAEPESAGRTSKVEAALV